MDSLTFKSYGKINLTLEIINKRIDGYHNLFSIMQTIDLFDIITFSESSKIEIECNNKEINESGNIIEKAITLLKDYSHTKKGIRISLDKNIPISAGLGGGSSNAAIVLIVLNTIWNLKINTPTLHRLSSMIGSDVPFFLKGGTALTQGRGEKIKRLPKIQKLWILLVPEKNVMKDKTQQIYNNLLSSDYSDGSYTLELQKIIKKKQKISHLSIINSLRESAMQLFQNLEKTESKMIQAGAKAVHLSGSGPTLFSMHHTKKEAVKVKQLLGEHAINSILTTTIDDSRWSKSCMG